MWFVHLLMVVSLLPTLFYVINTLLYGQHSVLYGIYKKNRKTWQIVLPLILAYFVFGAIVMLHLRLKHEAAYFALMVVTYFLFFWIYMFAIDVMVKNQQPA